MAYVNTQQIKAQYAPYNTIPAFEQGYADYLAGRASRELQGVAGQAYDRGYEAGMKVQRANQWVEQNVGAN